jgi:hypothetical protein
LDGSVRRPFVHLVLFIGNDYSISHRCLAGVRAIGYAVIMIAGIGIGRTSVHFLK